jgi:hypothetical protein
MHLLLREGCHVFWVCLLGIGSTLKQIVIYTENAGGDVVVARRAPQNFARQYSAFPDWQNPHKLLRFMQYSAAMYGFKMFIYEQENPWKR